MTNFITKFSREDWAAICLGVYLATTLVAQAVMSLGLLFLVFAFILLFRGPAKTVRFEPIRGSWAASAYRRAAVLLFLALLASLIGAWIAPVTIGDFTIQVSFARDLLKAWYLFLPLLVWQVGIRLSAEGFSRVIQFWLLACAVISVVGVIQYFTGWPKPQQIPHTPGRYHATLFLGHHLSVASIWIFPAFAAISLAIHRNGPRLSRLSRPVLWGVTTLAFTALYLSYSRMLWVALLMGMMVFGLLLGRRQRRVLVPILFVVIGFCSFQIPEIRLRMLQFDGMQTRFDLWEANRDFFKMRPVFGTGWRKSGDLSGPYLLKKFPDRKTVFAGHAHSTILEVLAGTGVVGTLAWLFWSFTVFWILWKGRNGEVFSAFYPGLVAAWTVFQLNGLTQVNFWEGKVLHQMMWAVGLSLIIWGRSLKKQVLGVYSQ